MISASYTNLSWVLNYTSKPC